LFFEELNLELQATQKLTTSASSNLYIIRSDFQNQEQNWNQNLFFRRTGPGTVFPIPLPCGIGAVLIYFLELVVVHKSKVKNCAKLVPTSLQLGTSCASQGREYSPSPTHAPNATA
jgi:hypothetical protein